MAVNQLPALSALPSPPNRFVGDQERFDEMAYQSLKAQEKMVNEDLNKAFIPALNRFAMDVNTSVEDAARSERNAGASADSASASAGTATVKAEEAALSAESAGESEASSRTAREMAELAAMAARGSEVDAQASAAVAKREKDDAVVASRLAEDAARHVLNATSGVMQDRLFVVGQMAQQATVSMRQDIARYRDWHEHGIEKLIALAQTAETACRRGDASIKAYDQDRQLRRVQLELSKDKVPLLFIVAGQSNAVGCSSKGTYESAADVAQFWDFSSPSGKLSPLKDPVYRSTRGSAWPAFARTVFNLTGRPVYLLNAASSGSAVTDGGYTATNTWADNGHGTLRATAKAAYDAMTASLDAQNLPYQLGGLLWCQGESETGRLMAGTVTRQDYINATKDVFAYFRTVTHSPSLPVFLSKIGYTSTYAANADVRRAYETIQQAQEAICQSESLVHMAFRLAPTFFDIGCMSDSIHYDQRGYNMMGEALARCAASILNLN